jgi:hypothetical protein
VRRSTSGNAAYDMSGTDSLTFVLGPRGIDADLAQIEAGEKLGEMWTYIQVPSSVLSTQTIKDTLQLNVDGVVVAHESFGDDPTASTATLKDFRLDFVTSPSTTRGSIEFDRGSAGSVYFDVTYKGTSTVYGPPIYLEFEITTGFPI